MKNISRNIKKTTALGMALLFGLSLMACGSDDSQSAPSTPAAQTEIQTDETAETVSDSDSFFPFGECFFDGRFYSGDLTAPENTTTAADIYGKMTYSAQMFYGDYRLNHPDDGVPTAYASQTFLDTCSWWNANNVSSTLGYETISSIPYRMVSGTAELDSPLMKDETHNWCQLYFATNTGTTGVTIDAAYEVSGNRITFTPVLSWSFNEETMELTYTLEDRSFGYDFEFCGPKLTFSNETESYTLIERDFTSWLNYVIEDNVSVESTLSQNSPSIDNITGIDMTVYMDASGKLNLRKSTFSLTCTDADGKTNVYSGIAKWDEDGLFSFSYEGEGGKTFAHQLVMFYCGFDGMVFSDGKKNYYYLSTYMSEVSAGHYEYNDELGANISEEDQEILEGMTQEEIEEIIETRTDLLADLATAFDENGIAATIDETTGEIVMDSSILFNTGEYKLSADGESALTAFITAFASVISDNKYDGFISKVEVQGHTDSDGNYDYNLELSQQRADTVKEYCLNVSSLSTDMVSKLSALLDAVGYSYDYPVYDANGAEDKDASRRVEFIFFINIAGRSGE